jgi:putative nucleotidyltransferase with HDIG domain
MKDWIKNENINWQHLEQYAWVKPLRDCPQDPEWHAEGNVYIHTKMVADALVDLAGFKALNGEEKEILLFAALLHDVAKPQCTYTDEDGRIVSPRHAKVGEKVARDLLWDMDLTKRELVCSLVRLHGLPLWSLDKINPNRSVIEASLRVKNEWTYLLSTADVLGRICTDQADLLDKLEYFKELCIENECFSGEKVFHNAHSQFKFFLKNEVYPPILFDDSLFTMVLLSGIAGSGKDTYSYKLNLPIVSLDAIRQQLKIKPNDKSGQSKVIQEAYLQAKTHAGKRQSFVWNSTNITEEVRSKLINLIAPYNPYVKIVYIETSRENVYKSRHETIPAIVLEKMYRILEVPTRNEAHEVEYIRW